jgi:hypothetical protein
MNKSSSAKAFFAALVVVAVPSATGILPVRAAATGDKSAAAAKHHWRPAPVNQAVLPAAKEPAGPSLRQLAAQVGEEAKGTVSQDSATPRNIPKSVAAGDCMPWAYQPSIRRYFESIRFRQPGEDRGAAGKAPPQ